MLGAGAAACSAGASGTNGTGASSEGGSGAGFGDGGSGAGFEGGGNAGGASSDGCSEAAKLVYVIGEGNTLYSFQPQELAIEEIGIVSCPQNGAGATPFSMAVDRSGTAWVLFNDGHIYHVDVTTAACTTTPYQPGQQGLTTFGMGFVADEPGSTKETLYVADYFGEGIAKIDTATYTLSPIIPFNALFSAAELTGTGDARLFGFFQQSPIVIAEVDKSTGHILSQAPQPSVNIGSGWAFAFWGGDFWLFTSPTGLSQVDRYQPSTGTTSTVLTGIGDNIVGAGVSTCAPTAPPQ